MAKQYTSLSELREQKALLKKEISEKEELLSFSNAKESLGLVTQGYTDKFLDNVSTEKGKPKTTIKKEVVVKEISNKIMEGILSKNAMMGVADSAIKGGVIEDAIRLGAVAMVGKYAKKKISSKKWKNKLIGMALIYIAPIILRYLHQKLENYQKNKSISSMEKLI